MPVGKFPNQNVFTEGTIKLFLFVTQRGGPAHKKGQHMFKISNPVAVASSFISKRPLNILLSSLT